MLQGGKVRGSGGGGGGMCSVLLSVGSCEWWLLNQFVALVYLESVLTISRHPNKVSIIIEWCCVRVCISKITTARATRALERLDLVTLVTLVRL